MNCIKETFQFDKDIPIKINLHQERKDIKQRSKETIIPMHWHNSLEITYVISGQINYIVEGINYSLGEDDIILINIGEIHSGYAENKFIDSVTTLIIPHNLLKKNYKDIDNVIFNLDNSLAKKRIKKIIKDITMIYSNKKDELDSIIINQYIYEMLYILFKDCMKYKKLIVSFKSDKYKERVVSITEYIKNNYREYITLESVAREYGISKEHLSRIFKNYLGTTFKKYLEYIRLNNARIDLVNTDYDITKVALENGFPNIKAFNNSFKKESGQTPSQYRSKLKSMKK